MIVVLEEIDMPITKMHDGSLIPHRDIPTQITNKTDWNQFFDRFDRLQYPYVYFIMTTNNLDQIDDGIENRSVVIDMNFPPAANWLPILRRVYTDAHLAPPSDAALEQVVTAGRGSARSIFTDVVMAANQAKKAGQTSVFNVANLRS